MRTVVRSFRAHEAPAGDFSVLRAHPQSTLLAHIKTTAETTLPAPTEFELGIYHLNGQLDILSPGEAVLIPQGECILLGGEPAEEPLLFGGPFVMDTPENLQQAQRDYYAGRMGTLDGGPY